MGVHHPCSFWADFSHPLAKMDDHGQEPSEHLPDTPGPTLVLAVGSPKNRGPHLHRNRPTPKTDTETSSSVRIEGSARERSVTRSGSDFHSDFHRPCRAPVGLKKVPAQTLRSQPDWSLKS